MKKHSPLEARIIEINAVLFWQPVSAKKIAVAIGLGVDRTLEILRIMRKLGLAVPTCEGAYAAWAADTKDAAAARAKRTRDKKERRRKSARAAREKQGALERHDVKVTGWANQKPVRITVPAHTRSAPTGLANSVFSWGG